MGGGLKTLTYPSGRVVTYTTDTTGQLVSAVDGNGVNYVTSALYNPDESLKSFLNGSTPALSSSLQYNPRLQLCRITTLTSGTLPASCTDSQHIGNVMDRGYDFHIGNGTSGSGTDNGNVMAITNYRDTSRSQAFTYDALNRMTAGWSSANTGAYSWGENYSIDAWGNLQISPMSGKAHGGNFTLSSTVQNQPTGLSYDAAGNLMAYLSASYVYDPENRIASTAGMSYTYDGNGERVLKSQTAGGAPVKRYWSMDGKTLAEGDGSGNLTAEYIYLGSKRIARIDLPANTVHYYLSDRLASTSMVVSSSGVTEEESDYYPFGTEVIVTGPGTNELKFTGKRRDTESQLDYFGARYYSNGLGRFITPDWSAKPATVPYAVLGDPQSLNLYAYVVNNPSTKIDPNGHNWFQNDGKWEWHKGDKYTYKGKDGHQHTLTSKYTSLLVAQPTGTSRTGATTYKLTLFNQDKKVAEGTGFSGGGGNPAIKAGNYTINTQLRDPNGPNTINPNSALNNPPPFFGIQKMHNIPTGDGREWDVVGAYGEIRARLNPWSGKDDGDYFHGQSNGHGYTHGCLCYGTDTRFIDYLWNAPPQKVPVAVDVPVVQP